MNSSLPDKNQEDERGIKKRRQKRGCKEAELPPSNIISIPKPIIMTVPKSLISSYLTILKKTFRRRNTIN